MGTDASLFCVYFILFPPLSSLDILLIFVGPFYTLYCMLRVFCMLHWQHRLPFSSIRIPVPIHI